jgi:hypothetical protein
MYGLKPVRFKNQSFSASCKGWAHRIRGMQLFLRPLLRFSLVGFHATWALPALKRVIRVETLHGALKRPSPRINAGAPTIHLNKADCSSLTQVPRVYCPIDAGAAAGTDPDCEALMAGGPGIGCAGCLRECRRIRMGLGLIRPTMGSQYRFFHWTYPEYSGSHPLGFWEAPGH